MVILVLVIFVVKIIFWIFEGGFLNICFCFFLDKELCKVNIYSLLSFSVEIWWDDCRCCWSLWIFSMLGRKISIVFIFFFCLLVEVKDLVCWFFVFFFKDVNFLYIVEGFVFCLRIEYIKVLISLKLIIFWFIIFKDCWVFLL